MPRTRLLLLGVLTATGLSACGPAAVGVTGAAATITIINQGAEAAGSVIAAVGAFLDLIEREKIKPPPLPAPAAKDKG